MGSLFVIGDIKRKRLGKELKIRTLEFDVTNIENGEKWLKMSGKGRGAF